jgi:DNA-binding IscR family transcriptional regulator
MANGLGVKVTKFKKADIIRAIQKAEENFDCFGTATDYCDQMSCLFRSDCLGIRP